MSQETKDAQRDPAAERMRKLRLNMSQETKDAQREKERLSKKAKR